MKKIHEKAKKQMLFFTKNNIEQELFYSVFNIVDFFSRSFMYGILFILFGFLILTTSQSPTMFIIFFLFVGIFFCNIRNLNKVHKKNKEVADLKEIKINLVWFYFSVCLFKCSNFKDKNNLNLYFSFLFKNDNLEQLEKLLKQNQPKHNFFNIITFLIKENYKNFSNDNLKFSINFYKKNTQELSNNREIRHFYYKEIIPFCDKKIKENLCKKVSDF